MDLSKLTPAPWTHVQCHANMRTTAREGQEFSHADAEFIALARNAFDVMMRRGWGVMANYANRPGSFWKVIAFTASMDGWAFKNEFPDPFTALVEADKWYRENVERADG